MSDEQLFQGKLSILDIMYCQLIKKEITSTLQYLIGYYLKKDIYFSQYGQYHSSINQLTQWAFDLFFLLKFSCFPEEMLFNFLKIDKYNLSILSSQPYTKLLSYCLFQSIDRAIIAFGNNTKSILSTIISYLRQGVNGLIQFLFMFNEGFTYYNWIDYLFNIVTINKGNNNITFKIQQVALFSMYLLFKYSAHCITQVNNNYSITSMRQLPPPQKKQELNNLKGKCPICTSIISTTKIVTKCCGVIFCINCIEKYCLQNDKCMICDNYIHKSSLIKLYDSNTL